MPAHLAMASSRAMRKSPRTASPLNAATNGHSTKESNSLVMQGLPSDPSKLAAQSKWTEPPLRAPAPSFEDHKGLERQGVLEHMAPLGSMPNQKVKLRVKQYEPSRRTVAGKQGETAAGTKETSKAPDASLTHRRSESRKIEERPGRTLSVRERDEDQEYTPKVPVPKAAAPKIIPTRNSLSGTPSSKTTAGQERLRQVVDSAVERSKELGNEILGLAVRKLFEESLTNRTLADLLDAVLSQRPTQRQAADFQAYIKIARKQIKVESGLSRRSSTAGIGPSSVSVSKSPSKGCRPSVARQMVTPTNSAENEGTTSVVQPPHSRQASGGKSFDSDELTDGHRAKRVKRSKSMSSTSSLSSLSSTDPAIELDHDSNAEGQADAASTNEHKLQISAGPKLHTFSTKHFPHSNKRPSTTAPSTPDASITEDVVVRQRMLQRSFDDYSVNDSNLRSGSVRGRPSALFPDMFSSSTLQKTSNAEALRAGVRDNDEDLRSPASSTQDFLIPPPTGVQRVSRATTPSLLGRSKGTQVRKAARIKIS